MDLYVERAKSLQSRFDIRARGEDGEMYSIKDNKGYWISLNGEKRYPNQFDYDHLVNTLKKIERKCYEHYTCPDNFKIYRLLKEEYRLRVTNNKHLE